MTVPYTLNTTDSVWMPTHLEYCIILTWTGSSSIIPIKSVLLASQRVRLAIAMWKIPWWKGPEYSWWERLVLVALGGYKLVLTEIDTHPGLGFAFLVEDASAQSTTEKWKQKTLHRFGWPTIISLEQETHYTAHSVQQCT